MGLFGLESANQRTLTGIRKKQTVEQMNKALGIMKETGLKCFGLFMAFNVWEENGKLCFEDREDSLRTLAYLKGLLRDKKLHLFGWSMTTPYPGSELYRVAVKHNLIDKEYAGKWEYFDSGSNFLMKLPGVSEKDWLHVMNAGKRLQAMSLFRSGTFNLRAMPLYLKKAYYVAGRNLKRFFN
ncbi:MAG: hypothetical protein HS130_08560 [Deltaproteobacteria bacterium]|nr:hypothetical protein [Deltaproteobacteria bacterium]